jgi:hypothetical protein
MADQEKHLQQSHSAEEKKAIEGAQNAAKNADNKPGTAPVGPADPKDPAE